MPSTPEQSPDRDDPSARDIAATDLLVDEFVACRHEKAALDAREITALAAAGAIVDEQRARLTSRESRKTDIPARAMVAELAAAARVSERTIQRQLNDAVDLCARFSDVVDALAEARISRVHVAVIHEAGWAIDDRAARAEFVTAAIARAETMTPGRLRPIAEILAARVNPRTIGERHRDACAKRDVRVADLGDGMADVCATVPAVLAHGIYDRLTQHAHAVIAARTQEAADLDSDHPGERDEPAADARTMGQLRADILCDLLLTGTAETCTRGEAIDAIRATVQITVPVLTAAGRGAEPALLAGYGPVDPETARRLMGNCPGWERVMTSPVTGCVLAVDRYRPTEDMKRFLRVRDERCRFPGCRQPVWRCDLDHTIDAARGGPTAHCNLAHLCRRHHVLKHNSGWRVRQLDGGVLEWTSPTGRIYTDLPAPAVRFAPDPEPPPF
jgi:hypothetical protein